MPEPVRICVFGDLTATVDGAPVALGGAGTRAVLARLVAADGQVVSTDRLIEDLWSGQPPPKALAALQVHVSKLRRALEPRRAPRAPAQVLVSAPPGYALRLPAAAVDAWEFQELAAATDVENLAAAVRLWRGEPFHEHLDADWTREERARLVELRAAALEALAHARLELGQAAQVVAELASQVRARPDREVGVRLLALAQYRVGQQGAALRTLGRTRDYLAAELGVDPSPALRRMEEDILHQRDALAPERPAAGEAAAVFTVASEPVASEPAVSAAGSWGPVVLAGREQELATLAAAACGDARLLWVGGDAGQGKSALARAFTDHLAGQGWRVAWGSCPEVDGSPSAWPWLQILRALGGDGAEQSPFEISVGMHELLGQSEKAPAGRTVLVLDDVHRADEPTLQVLRNLVGATGAPVLVLCLFRPSEVGGELRATWAAAAGVPGGRLDLGGVGADGARSIARAAGAAGLDDELVARLLERTGGNPLFLQEYARLAASEGAAAVESTVPAGVRDVLSRRLLRLPDATVAQLRRASALGREVDLTLLGAVGALAEDELVDALEPAVVAGVLLEVGPNSVRFSHDLVRATLYEGLPRMRRRRTHAAALAALARLAPGDIAALARHAVESATPASAAAALPFVIAGAAHAQDHGCYLDALGWWRAAGELCALAGDVSAEQRLAVLVGRVGPQARTGDVDGARQSRADAVALATVGGDATALLSALTSWSAPVVWSIRLFKEPDVALLAGIEGALAEPALEPATRSLLLAARAFELEGVDNDGALAAAAQARDAARASGDGHALLRALNAYGYLAFGPDLHAERSANAEELLAAATAVGDEGYVSLAHFQRFLAATSETDLDAAYAAAELATRYAAGHQLAQILSAVAAFEALVELMAGRVDSALLRYDAVAAQLHEQGMASAQWFAIIGRIGAARMRGDFAPLRADLEELEARLPHSARFPLILALLDSGAAERARALWSETADYPRDFYWLAMTTLQASCAARLGDATAARRLRGELTPFAGRIAGLDSGSFYAGPVDAALAETAALLGEESSARSFAVAAAELVEEIAGRLRPR